MGERVYIFRAYEARPKYHAYGRIRDAIPERRSADLTICGQVIYDGQNRYDAYLREDHARLFATPCRRCFVVQEPTDA